MSDEADVILAQQGHKDAFVRLIKANEGTMYRVAASLLRSEESVADAIQDTILKSYSSIGALREPRFFKTWLIRILINRCQQMLNSDKRTVPIGDWINSVEGPGSYESVELQDLLNRLKAEHRIIVTLYYLEDISIKEIAKLLDIPAGTVKSRLSSVRNFSFPVTLNEEANKTIFLMNSMTYKNVTVHVEKIVLSVSSIDLMGTGKGIATPDWSFEATDSIPAFVTIRPRASNSADQLDPEFVKSMEMTIPIK